MNIEMIGRLLMKSTLGQVRRDVTDSSFVTEGEARGAAKFLTQLHVEHNEENPGEQWYFSAEEETDGSWVVASQSVVYVTRPQ